MLQIAVCSKPTILAMYYKLLKNYTLPSNIGFASNICCSIHECLPLIAARYCKINFVLSVFPAPLSPLKIK